MKRLLRCVQGQTLSNKVLVEVQNFIGEFVFAVILKPQCIFRRRVVQSAASVRKEEHRWFLVHKNPHRLAWSCTCCLT